MPRGRPKTKKKLAERRLEAFDCFRKGFSDVATAEKIGVTRQTVATYRDLYERSLGEQARANPELLAQVLQNTVRSLAELDAIREDAWKHLEDRKVRVPHECPRCEHEWKETIYLSVSDQTRAQYHNVLLKAQGERSKLFGLLGVKAEMLARIESVNIVQRALLQFMGEQLCNDDREKLARLLEGELRQHLNVSQPIAVTAELVAAGVE